MKNMIIISLLITMLFVAMMIGAFIALQIRKQKKNMLNFIVLLVLELILYFLMQNCFNVLRSGVKNGNVIGDEELLPVLISSLTIVAFLLIVSIAIYRIKQNKISPLSIKNSLEHMPVGLCYYTDDGKVHLSNNKMVDIASSLTGHYLDDGLELRERLLNEDNISIRSKDNMPIIILGGRIFSFKFNDFDLFGQTIHEIISDDVTDIYSINLQLQTDNERLQKINERLSGLSETITTTTIEKELLDAKMNIHDDLGEALLISKKYIENPDGIDKNEIRRLWSESAGMMFKVKKSDKRNKYDLMMNTAKDVGVKISIIGELPMEDEIVPIVSSIIHECLTNTIRHAKGDELDIEVSRNGSDYICAFTNNGLKPQGTIEETGGLKSLRKMIEQNDGMMKVESEPEFRLTVMLKGETYGKA